MHRLNRKLEYSLMALKYMSAKKQGELTSAKEIVEVTGAPFEATARALQIMTQKNILRSEQGAHGGYLIVRDLNKVSMFDLAEMIVGPVNAAKCLKDNSCELHGTCNIQSPIQHLSRKMNEFYRSLSLSEVLRLKDSGVREL